MGRADNAVVVSVFIDEADFRDANIQVCPRASVPGWRSVMGSTSYRTISFVVSTDNAARNVRRFVSVVEDNFQRVKRNDSLERRYSSALALFRVLAMKS